MFSVTDKVVYAMSGLRMMSSILEMAGAILMLYFGTALRALQVNAALSFVGPLVLVTVTALGLYGLADDMQWWRVGVILLGVGCILIGAHG